MYTNKYITHKGKKAKSRVYQDTKNYVKKVKESTIKDPMDKSTIQNENIELNYYSIKYFGIDNNELGISTNIIPVKRRISPFNVKKIIENEKKNAIEYQNENENDTNLMPPGIVLDPVNIKRFFQRKDPQNNAFSYNTTSNSLQKNYVTMDKNISSKITSENTNIINNTIPSNDQEEYVEINNMPLFIYQRKIYPEIYNQRINHSKILGNPLPISPKRPTSAPALRHTSIDKNKLCIFNYNRINH